MSKIEIIRNSLKKRHQRESVFKICGLAGIIIAIFFLITILLTIFLEGKKAFYSTYISLNINFNSNVIDPDDTKDEKVIKSANFKKIIDDSLLNYFPEVKKRKEIMKLQSFISSSEEQNLMELVLKNPKLIGTTQKVWLLSSSTVDVINKNREMEKIVESDRLIDDRQLEWLKTLRFNEDIKLDYNKNFFVNADSTEPEQAGIWGSVVGSFFTLLVTLILSFPVAVAAGVFLEELAPKNKFTDFIEVNINNLAAVPSIIFGLLGLAIFLNVMHLPRSAPIVGGITLGLMTLPTIIIATRSSLKAVPPSIREAAIGLGATKFQTVTHHV